MRLLARRASANRTLDRAARSRRRRGIDRPVVALALPVAILDGLLDPGRRRHQRGPRRPPRRLFVDETGVQAANGRRAVKRRTGVATASTARLDAHAARTSSAGMSARRRRQSPRAPVCGRHPEQVKWRGSSLAPAARSRGASSWRAQWPISCAMVKRWRRSGSRRASLAR